VTPVAGILLALALLTVYGFALRWIVESPFRALGVLVAGMAFHNVILMFLLRLGTPAILVRVVQAWKEGILLLLVVLLIVRAARQRRSRRRIRLRYTDVIALAFTVLVLVYLLTPTSLVHNQANLTQRLLGARIAFLLPLLYLFGRVLSPPSRGDLLAVGGLVVGAAALVGALGLIELWFVPTRTWLDWGVNSLTTWLGFRYNGPGGLPPNFFQTSAQGFLVRRMVSTYVSPLGTAYTGLVILPIAVVLLIDRVRTRSRMWILAALGLTFLVLGVAFSVTRLASAMMLAEFVFLLILFGRRWLVGATVLAGVVVLFTLYAYPEVAPIVNPDLSTPATRPHHLQIVSTADSSLREHGSRLGYDLGYVVAHPLGTGLGSSVHRFGTSTGTGESALFDMFGDLGFTGGTLYLVLYASAIAAGSLAYLRVRRDPLATMLPLVAFIGGLALIPITLTSDVWSDFSVTFLFWWAAGASNSILAAAPVARHRPADQPRRAAS
jgi:hypothetical protein